MALSEFVTSLKSALRDLATRFTDPDDFERLIAAAVREYSRYRPAIVRDSVTLVAGTDSYAVTGLRSILHSPWGRTRGKPWEDSPGTPPNYYVESGQIVFETAPSGSDIGLWGAIFKFTGRGAHTVDETNSTISEEDEDLILLRARAEALAELADDQAGKAGGHKSASGYGTSRDATLAGRANRLLEDWYLQMGVGSGVLQRTTARPSGGRS